MSNYLTSPHALISAGALIAMSFLGGCTSMGAPAQGSTLPPTAFPPHTGSDSVVQMRVAPDQSFGGPVIRVDGEFDVRMISRQGVYHVLVQPRSAYAGGSVNILVGGLDNVQVEINRLPPPGAAPTGRVHAQRPLDTRPLIPAQAFVPQPEQPAASVTPVAPAAPAVAAPAPKSPAPATPAVKSAPARPAPSAPSRAFVPDPDAPGPVVPPSNAHAQARQRLRQDVDKASPW